MDPELNRSFGLSIRDENSVSSRAEMAWEDFAFSAGAPDNTNSPVAVAELLNQSANMTFTPLALYHRMIDLCSFAANDEAGDMAQRLSQLVLNLRPELLADTIKAKTDLSERKRGLNKLADVLSPEALQTITVAAAYVFGRPLSPVLAGLLDKLSREAEELPDPMRQLADRSFRDLFKYVVEAWTAASVDRASAYESLFMGRHTEVSSAHAGRIAPEPQRVLAMALETGAVGSVLWTAVAEISATEDGVRDILTRLKDAPTSSKAAGAVAQKFATPVRLAVLLREDPVDFKAVDGLLARMGDAAVVTLLDAVAEAKTRTTRRAILDRLVAIGPSIGPTVIMRLSADHRWYVQRNMFTVLREAHCVLGDLKLENYTQQGDARVRREAMQLRLADPLDRDRALTSALRDSDVGMLKLGLRAARNVMSDTVAPIVAKRVVESTFPPELRTAALYLLGRSNSALALEALLTFVSGGTTLLGRPRLAPKSAEMLVALGALARGWPTDRRVAPIVALAKASKDPDIVKAVSAGSVIIDEKLTDDE